MVLEGANLTHEMIREEIIKRSQEKGREASARAFIKFKAGFKKEGRAVYPGFFCLVARRSESIVRNRNDGNEELPVKMIAQMEFREGL